MQEPSRPVLNGWWTTNLSVSRTKEKVPPLLLVFVSTRRIQKNTSTFMKCFFCFCSCRGALLSHPTWCCHPFLFSLPSWVSGCICRSPASHEGFCTRKWSAHSVSGKQGTRTNVFSFFYYSVWPPQAGIYVSVCLTSDHPAVCRMD